MLFAVFHIVWAAGWYIGLNPEQSRIAFAKPAFLAYDLVVAGMCLVAVPLSLALGMSWGKHMPRRLLLIVGWSGTILLGVRAVGSLLQGVYELTTGRFTFARMGLWEPWFYLGAGLFAANLWLHLRRSEGAAA